MNAALVLAGSVSPEPTPPILIPMTQLAESGQVLDPTVAFGAGLLMACVGLAVASAVRGIRELRTAREDVS